MQSFSYDAKITIILLKYDILQKNANIEYVILQVSTSLEYDILQNSFLLCTTLCFCSRELPQIHFGKEGGVECTL